MLRRSFRLLFFIVVGALAIGAVAPAANPPLPFIASGVKVLEVPVGGMTSESARRKLRKALAKPVTFGFYKERWKVSRKELGARPDIERAIQDALAARPRRTIPLRVAISRPAIRSYVAGLDRRFSRPAVDSELAGLDGNLAPLITEAKRGVEVQSDVMAAAIRTALRWNKRETIPLRLAPVEPSVTPDDFHSIIVIRRESKQLSLYYGSSPVRSFRVAVGQDEYPTPLGQWSIVDMQRDPWWRPPPSEWAKDLEPIPPGPGNPLGTRWMGLSAPAVGIHGTPDAASVGYSASHGCIRMLIPEAAWLFEQVGIGTPVFIVSA